MKKILIIIIGLLALTACSKNNDNVLKEMEKTIDNINTYHLMGDLTIKEGEEKYSYKVDVVHKKNSFYRVSLINKDNSHEQIILKNEEGVYVVTPSLNKSFKFQSAWPNNSSQSYILDCILSDIKNDEERNIIKKDNDYEVIAKVNYPNNKELKEELIKIDEKTYLPKAVYIKNDKKEVTLEMIITKIDTKTKYDNNYFSLSNNIKEVEEDKETSSLDTIVYPMYLPVGTKYQKEEKVLTGGEEKIILTYTGEKPFTLIEEASKKNKDHTTVAVSGEVAFYGNVLGVMSNTTLSWNENEREYYLISEDLSKEELLKIALSTSSVPITK